MAGAVASGDLTRRIEVASRDETGQLLQALRDMNNSLSDARTETDLMVKEIAMIVGGAARGDFSVRIDLQGKAGFFLQFGESMNKLMHTSETALDDVARMLRALSQGDLNERISSEYHGTFGQLKDDANRTAEQLNEIIVNEVGRVLEALSRGDLTEKIGNDYPGAFGQLKEDANSTVDKLMEIIAQVKYSTDMITTAAQEIAAGNNDLSQRTEEHASSLEETTSSMEELLSKVRQNAESARHAHRLAQGSCEVTEQSGDGSGKTGGNNGLHQQILKEDRRYHQRYRWDRLSDQHPGLECRHRSGARRRAGTGLRGGGRRGTQPGAALGRRRQGNQALDRQFNGERNRWNVQVKEAADTISDVATSVQLVASLMKDISDTTTEQSLSIEQVNAAIVQMDTVTQQNAALVEEAAAAAESMEEQTGALVRTVGTFKLDATRMLPGADAHSLDKSAGTLHRQKLAAPNLPGIIRKPAKVKEDKDDDWKVF